MPTRDIEEIGLNLKVACVQVAVSAGANARQMADSDLG
jgi:hypothetical protein